MSSGDGVPQSSTSYSGGVCRAPLVGRWARLEFDLQIILLSNLAGLPAFALAMYLLWTGDVAILTRWLATGGILLLWGGLTAVLRARLVRPIRTLSSVLLALREGDFSIRTRVPKTLKGPLALAFQEANRLEAILREQRLGAVEATVLLRRILEEIDVAVFAFDEDEKLRILNRAGERLLGQPSEAVLGRSAADLRLLEGLAGEAPRTMEVNLPGGQGRWELKRTVIRQEGAPMRLLVLSDLSRALREEERLAWKRIIRVLSHEINNSLAPIKSIASSLRKLVSGDAAQGRLGHDLSRGLGVIVGRAESLGRFMAAYARLARLPAPNPVSTPVGTLIRRSAELETRLKVEVAGGPELSVMVDPDQLDQLLINLVRNAADSALECGGGVRVGWRVRDGRSLEVTVEDEGQGVRDTTNLFVPFYSTKPGGSGIGLVLCQQIAEGHGGRLTLRNRNPRGAVAILSLPLETRIRDTRPRTRATG
ncbi:MAG: ATP-binding protein [Gemmatimonadota bacterium]|nr:ATP-binding protein [Gemmatimonadota bacterium]